jgi:CDP-paratose 2-epimerase
MPRKWPPLQRIDMDKKILITGGAGFVGSSLAMSLKRKYPNYTVVAADNLKRRGSELNLPRLKESGIQFIHADIRQRADIESLDADFTTIIEASAEPSVLAGLNGTPDYLIETNLSGTINCLYFAKRIKADFIFLSTSRVYPIAPLESCAFVEEETRFSYSAGQSLHGVSERGIGENFSLNGARSLYGATKLSSELLIHEFNSFYGLKTVINRCGVLTGPWQMGKVDQGVMVLWVAKHFWKKQLSYIGYGGEGKQVRDLLHVDDLFRLIDIQVHDIAKYNGEVFNVGGGREVSLSLRELTTLSEEVTGNKIHIEKVKENRPADVRMYITDNSKITSLSGWKPEISREQVIRDIFNWLKENERSLKDILS